MRNTLQGLLANKQPQAKKVIPPPVHSTPRANVDEDQSLDQQTVGSSASSNHNQRDKKRTLKSSDNQQAIQNQINSIQSCVHEAEVRMQKIQSNVSEILASQAQIRESLTELDNRTKESEEGLDMLKIEKQPKYSHLRYDPPHQKRTRNPRNKKEGREEVPDGRNARLGEPEEATPATSAAQNLGWPLLAQKNKGRVGLTGLLALPILLRETTQS